MTAPEPQAVPDQVAVIGMACRLPGARNVDEFWRNLREGVESISFFSDKELLAAGLDAAMLRDPRHVRAAPVLDGIEWFDAGLFNFSPRQAELTDPQQRLFIECAWEALEHAGYDPATYDGAIGVYAGSILSNYLLFNLYPVLGFVGIVGDAQTIIANDKDYLPTLVSYKLNLRGPSVGVQTACSTSLVAVHLACQSLLNGECDMALAGGVAVRVPQKSGYFYQEGGLMSPDGHCRPFDVQGQGMVYGSGLGVVVLKRLADALAEGDHVEAVIRGSAINNDGALRVSFTAPGEDGQAEVIAEALSVAQVEPETISYIEAHGTGTPIGDPIEIAALSRVFCASMKAKGSCAIGSVKSNVGHLEAAAGIASLIKSILALKHKQLPPSLNFSQPNPRIDFAAGPFYVNTQLAEWKADGHPRRTGVSSFGIGGTNAHVVLEESPDASPSGPSRPWQLLTLSAKTTSALDTISSNLLAHLKQHLELNLADVAYTLKLGRAAMTHRQMLVCRDVQDAIAALEACTPDRVLRASMGNAAPRMTFVLREFEVCTNTGRALYQVEPAFRERVDECAELLKLHLGLDLRSALYPSALSLRDPKGRSNLKRLDGPNGDPLRPLLALPALCVIEYALASLWMDWNIQPQAMTSHGAGELVAACLAGVFSLKDALMLAAARGKLIEQFPGGIEAASLPSEAHSLVRLLDSIPLREPRIACVSARTGESLAAAQATDRKYWLARLTRAEIASGASRPRNDTSFGALTVEFDPNQDQAQWLSTLGQLWLNGAAVNWRAFYAHEARRRVILPTYPFERQRYWIEPKPMSGAGALTALPTLHARSNLSTPYIAPRDETEYKIAAIWQSVLGIEPIGVHDNFFELGGQSLWAVQLVARLREEFRVELPVSSLLTEAPTVAGMAQAIAQRDADGAVPASAVPALPAIRPSPEERHQPFPLTDLQQAYWVGRGGTFELGNVSCHGYAEFDSDALDLDRFIRAWHRLIERQHMLRMIVLPDGRQQILELVPPYKIEVLDLRGYDPAEAEAQLAAIRERMSHQVLPAEQWPLFELRVTRLDDRCSRIHLSMDALITDGYSFRILAHEFNQLYAHPEIELSPLELSFREYVLGELALRESELYRRSLEYWQSRLPNLPPAPELPFAKSLSAVAHPRFQRRKAVLPAEAWQRLKARARQSSLTPSGVVLAAYAEVLACWSKSQRFTINVPRFNRLPLHPQANDITGEFASFTLLEVDFLQPGSFDAHARRVQAQLWQDMGYQYVSGVHLLRELGQIHGQPPGAAVMPVVFTSMLVLDSLATGPAPWAALGTEVYGITQTPQVCLDMQVLEQDEALHFNWDAVEELYPAGLLDDMFDALCRLLERLAQDESAWKQPGRPPLPLTQFEQRASLRNNAAPIPDKLAHELFAERVAAQPEQVALVTSTRQFTYADVYRRSTRIGRKLRQAGARPNMLIAVVMEKGWEQVVGVMGAVMSGAAYLPIDPEVPPERFHHLIESGEVELALTQARLDGRLDWPEGVQRFCVDVEDEWAGISDEPVSRAQTLDDLLYVIYTSGSTGLPKGAMITQRGLVNAVIQTNERFGVGSSDRILAVTALYHDMSVYDVFGLLAVGGAVVMPDAEARLDPAHWSALMLREQVTLWNSVPALMEALLDHAERQPGLLPPTLRFAFLGGDWIPVTAPERLRALVPGAQVVSVGGPTETTLWNIWYPVERVDPAWKSIPYGKPIANARYYVLSESLEECPTWAPGEMCCAGVGVALGYWRDPVRTQERFVQHPRTGERLYRTGDVGRLLPDGNLEFLGRVDLQIKLMGYRIEPGEIEAALCQHPNVRTAVVSIVQDDRGHKRLAAHIVPHHMPETAESLTSELREFAQGKLPRQMIPSDFLLLDALPLTPNGKVDRKALARLADTHRADAEFVEPRTATEKKLASIWQEVLQVERVSVHDNFFNLGGNSLLITSLASRIRTAFQIELALPRLFVRPTVAGLAQIVEEAQAAGLSSSAAVTFDDFERGIVSLQRLNEVDGRLEDNLREDEQSQLAARLVQQGLALWAEGGDMCYWGPKGLLTPTLRQELLEHKSEIVALLGEGQKHTPLSFAQQRMWLMDQLMPGNPFYNLSIALRLAGPLCAEALERAIGEIVRRHEALRTTFRALAGQPAQVIALKAYGRLNVIDLTARPEQERKLQVRRQYADEARRPFDLARGPLFRAALARLSPDEHILILTMHHIVADGWSLGVFIRELAALYAAYAAGQPSSLPDLAFQYSDYTLWQRHHLKPETVEAQLAYWRKQLADTAELKLPTDRPRPPIPTYRGATHFMEFPKRLIDPLAALGQQTGATLFMVMLAAFTTLLHRYAGQDDIVIGCPTANRSRAEIEGLMGFFVSTQVIRADCSGSPTFRELLSRVRQVCVEAYANQDAPFEKVVAELHPDRDLSRNPLFQVVLALQNPLIEKLPAGDVIFSPDEFDTAAVRFDLEWHIWESPVGMQGAFVYSVDLFEPATIERMAGHLQVLLEGIVANPDRKLAELPLLTLAEQQQLLMGTNPRRRKRQEE